ncbi:hypothetical protein LPE509_00611 [Legionella pneumophila subsp. pneumophila LPE509]|nr:hypothetical protein LPE509_00611 [Legionella pneumophila subsp. pneumophila LPE509]
MLLNQRILKKLAVFVNNRQVIHFSNLGIFLLAETTRGFFWAYLCPQCY